MTSDDNYYGSIFVLVSEYVGDNPLNVNQFECFAIIAGGWEGENTATVLFGIRHHLSRSQRGSDGSPTRNGYAIAAV